MLLNKKVFAFTAVLIAVLTLLMQGITPSEASSEKNLEKVKSLIFLEDVACVDMKAYTISKFETMSDENHTVGYPETTLTFVLTSQSGGKIEALMQFINGTLSWCSLYMLKGTPILKVQYPENLPDIAGVLLETYQVRFNASYCSELVPLLNKVSAENRDQSVTAENAKLSVTVQENHVNFRWNYKANGIEAPRKTLSLTFENSFLRGFVDTWGITKIGGTTVNVSEEDAKSIALKTAQKFVNELGAKVTKIEAMLDLYNDEDSGRGDCYTLYPRWSVMLYFDKVYGGNVNGYYVAIWADTRDVFQANPQGYYGSTVHQEPCSNVTPLVIMLLFPAALAIAVIVYKKRSSRL